MKIKKETIFLFMALLNQICLIWFPLLGLIKFSAGYWVFFIVSALILLIIYGHASKVDEIVISSVLLQNLYERVEIIEGLLNIDEESNEQ